MAYLLCANNKATAWLSQYVISPHRLFIVKRAREKKAPVQEASPAWDCEQGSLPIEPSPPSFKDITALSPPETTTASSVPPVGIEQAPSAVFVAKQVQNASRQHWLPWQDRFLVQEISSHWPFLAPAEKAREEAWDRLAAVMLEDSAQKGVAIDRTGDSCRARFKRLVKAHKVSCCIMYRGYSL